MTSASMPSMIALYMDDDDHRHHDDPVIHIEDDVSNGRMVHASYIAIYDAENLLLQTKLF